MKLSMMTLGCPTWDLDTICKRGREYGFDAVDFRGLQDTLDVTTLPAFTTGVAQTRRKLDDAGLVVSGVSSSIRICDASARQANLEEARRTIGVAKALGAPNIRIFGGGDEKGGLDKAADVGAACFEEILAIDGAADLNWVFETHDLWIRGADCKLLLDRIPHPAFGALWDMGHTARVGGESPQQTFVALSGRVRYTHVKDAVHQPDHPAAMKDGWRYVPPGEGQLPLAESIQLLRSRGYDGYLVFEHEKRWIPKLPEPEEIFPKFVRWARSVVNG